MRYLVAFCILFITSLVQAQNEFQGFFIGLDINYHYLFGGAQVEGKETIGDGLKPAVGISTGYRWQFDNDLVFGIEVSLAPFKIQPTLLVRLSTI